MENRYYYPELDLDGTADELFIQARNGYIEDPAALHVLEEILRNPAEKKDDKADYVKVLYEIAEDEHDEPYVFAQYKKDILDGCGSEEVTLRDGLTLNILDEHGKVTVWLDECAFENAENGRTGAVSVDTDQFMSYSKEEFRDLVNGIYYYNMVENE